AILAASEGVFLLITGHGHSNTKHLMPRDWDGVDPTLGFWELMLASTLDFPMHSRIIEVVDEGNDVLSIYATNLGHNSPPGSLPHQAREMAAAKTAFPGVLEPGDATGNWMSNLSSMNLLLRVQVPSAVGSELRRYDWPSLIESEVTLTGFSAPE
ncbi:MAG: hypothetical protein GWP91_24970, partial [Rhodobacterales bacterium]|nr:hypothetical protein [Rhodobacterales bacterium]